MFCKNCGKKSEDNQKFCTTCGTSFSGNAPTSKRPKGSWGVGKIITVLIILGIIGFSIYSSLDEESIELNNQAISSFSAGDNQQAISQLERASGEAVGEDTKMNTLLNLGYVYSTELQYEQALQAFKEALTYADEGSFEHYLISGEIALLEAKPNAAQISYTKAYELRPNDFQINNALNLFYLDLDELAPYYVDYPKALQHGKKAYEVGDELTKNIARQNLAIAHFFNENYNQAISLLSSTDLNKEPIAAYWIGVAYAAQGDEINARLYLQMAADAGIEMEQEFYDFLYSY